MEIDKLIKMAQEEPEDFKRRIKTLVDLAEQEWDRGGYYGPEDWPELADALLHLSPIVYDTSVQEARDFLKMDDGEEIVLE